MNTNHSSTVPHSHLPVNRLVSAARFPLSFSSTLKTASPCSGMDRGSSPSIRRNTAYMRCGSVFRRIMKTGDSGRPRTRRGNQQHGRRGADPQQRAPAVVGNQPAPGQTGHHEADREAAVDDQHEGGPQPLGTELARRVDLRRVDHTAHGLGSGPCHRADPRHGAPLPAHPDRARLPDARRFRPTPRMARLGGSYTRTDPLPRLAQSQLVSARRAFGGIHLPGRSGRGRGGVRGPRGDRARCVRWGAHRGPAPRLQHGDGPRSSRGTVRRGVGRPPVSSAPTATSPAAALGAVPRKSVKDSAEAVDIPVTFDGVAFRKPRHDAEGGRRRSGTSGT